MNSLDLVLLALTALVCRFWLVAWRDPRIICAVIAWLAGFPTCQPISPPMYDAWLNLSDFSPALAYMLGLGDWFSWRCGLICQLISAVLLSGAVVFGRFGYLSTASWVVFLG